MSEHITLLQDLDAGKNCAAEAAAAIRDLESELSTLRESMRWLPMETAPSERAVDIWIKSTKNEEYGIRSCNVWMVGDEWHGGRVPLEKYGEYAAHWMPLPKPPEDSSDA